MTTPTPAPEREPMQPLWSDEAIINLLTRDVATFKTLVRLRNDYETDRATQAATIASLEGEVTRVQTIYLQYHDRIVELEAELAEQAGWKTVPLGEYADENGKVLELFEDETVLCIRLTIFNPRYDSYGHHEAIWQVPDNWRLQRKRRTESEGE